MPLSKSAKPPRLSELQGWLKEVWTTPAGVDAALALPAGRALKSWIAEVPPISARDRLAIYSDAYFSRLLESLGEDFAAVKRVLGEGDFRRLIADYLAAHGSSSYNISDAGGGLAAFAETHAIRNAFRFLPDLCRLEWAALRALLTDRLPAPAPDAFSKLSTQDWQRAKLVLDPTLTLLESRWALAPFWERRLEPADGLLPEERPAYLAVWRDDDWARVEELSADAWETLRRLKEGTPLSEACVGGPDDVQHWFAKWLDGGVIKGVQH